MFPSGPYHALTQLLPEEVIHVSLLQAVKVMLKASVCVRVAVSKLVNIFFSVKTKCKGHHIIFPMVRAAVVVDIFGRQSLPERYKEIWMYQSFKLQTVINGNKCPRVKL